MYFADYREVDGLKLPLPDPPGRSVPDTIEETTFDRIRINAKIDPRKVRDSEMKKPFLLAPVSWTAACASERVRAGQLPPRRCASPSSTPATRSSSTRRWTVDRR